MISRDFSFPNSGIKESPLIAKILKGIKPLDQEMMAKARAHQDNLTKPRGSLGRLEELAITICGIRAELHPEIKKKRVVVFAGDHGIVEEGVSAYPKEVTAQMVLNFLNQGAGINAIAGVVGAELSVVDIGVDYDFPELKGLIRKKVGKGARNFSKGPAMTFEETVRGLEIGIELAEAASEQGVDLIAGGEMGIGNTTPASAIFCAHLGLDPAQVVGPGAGLSSHQLHHKAEVIRAGLQANRESLFDPLKILSALGGFEIAGIAGLYLGAARNRMIALVDGFIATAAALAAIKIQPALSGHLIFSHISDEPGHQLVLEKMGVKPLLNLGMRLGEGTGAGLAMMLLESALACHNRMATFKSAGVSDKGK